MQGFVKTYVTQYLPNILPIKMATMIVIFQILGGGGYLSSTRPPLFSTDRAVLIG